MVPGLSCVVCADSYVNSTDISSTTCGHIFHMSCIRQWLRQSNTCPICSQGAPSPHRLYLDIDAINEAIGAISQFVINDGPENTVIIKRIKLHQIEEPLDLFRKIISIMRVPFTEHDIKPITELTLENSGCSMAVSFKMVKYKDMFLEKKAMLKTNDETESIRIYQMLSAETEELLKYSRILRKHNYRILFVENDKVFAKKRFQSSPIKILSKNHVDLLCLDERLNLLI